jgi:hypothetical protein
MIAEAVEVLGTPKGESVEHGGNRRDWKYHAQRINAAWSKRAEGVIETGQALIDARGELEKKTFRSLVESNELPFNHTTAFKSSPSFNAKF